MRRFKRSYYNVFVRSLLVSEPQLSWTFAELRALMFLAVQGRYVDGTN